MVLKFSFGFWLHNTKEKPDPLWAVFPLWEHQLVSDTLTKKSGDNSKPQFLSLQLSREMDKDAFLVGPFKIKQKYEIGNVKCGIIQCLAHNQVHQLLLRTSGLTFSRMGMGDL